jgi:ectoine hydroxylase-related dioxygenase (phytanoyl-CoA dioxygenase family)
MWIDLPKATRRFGSLTKNVAEALRALREDGIAILRGNNSAAECDAVLAAFGQFCAENSNHAEFADAYGFHERCCNLQLRFEAARALALKPSVLSIVEEAFEVPADIVGSLFFERGSEQHIHRDTPAFFTVPLNRYFGVWNALEDIHEDSGALSYYPGGHKLLPDAQFAGSGWENKDKYFDGIEQACIDAGIDRQYFLGKKGDTVIWHPQLPHGGSSIRDRSKSRRSIVFHYKAARLPIFGANHFFGPQDEVPDIDIHSYVEHGGRRFLNHGEPVFRRNRPEGNFDNKNK